MPPQGAPTPFSPDFGNADEMQSAPSIEHHKQGKQVVLPRDPRHFAIKKQTFFLKITDILSQEIPKDV